MFFTDITVKSIVDLNFLQLLCYNTAMPVKSDIKELATIIRKSRKLAGLSQLELAVRAGVGKTLVFNLEKGSAKVSFENLLKVLEVLNIKLEYKLPFHSVDE
jgi:predicted transcriptional regulator